MADKRPSQIVPSPQGGMVRDLVTRLKLIGRLMADRRVSIFVKLLPLASLAYLFSPVDLMPGVVLPVIGALDDAAVLWIGSTLSVELCPPKVVEEHMNQLTDNTDDSSNDDVVDAESTDVDDR